jgi:hypothetical protein
LATREQKLYFDGLSAVSYIKDELMKACERGEYYIEIYGYEEQNRIFFPLLDDIVIPSGNVYFTFSPKEILPIERSYRVLLNVCYLFIYFFFFCQRLFFIYLYISMF